MPGFTLAELLISLAIYGVMATFTIPKILHSAGNNQYNAMLKETLSTMAQGYQIEQNKGTITASTTFDIIIPHLNYVRELTSGTIQTSWSGSPTMDCDGASSRCFLLHNGGVLWFNNWESFGGTSNLHSVVALFDPDGTNPEKGVFITVYYNGRITTLGSMAPGTTTVYGLQVNIPDPDWVRL
jgi:prepilin-type N-terminal cleavage/methylation domain-containing protein